MRSSWVGSIGKPRYDDAQQGRRQDRAVGWAPKTSRGYEDAQQGHRRRDRAARWAPKTSLGMMTATTVVAGRIEPLIELLRGRQVVVLAGAGCSTESGIPDYRGPTGSLQTRKPIQYRDFVSSESARTRYWARSA